MSSEVSGETAFSRASWNISLQVDALGIKFRLIEIKAVKRNGARFIKAKFSNAVFDLFFFVKAVWERFLRGGPREEKLSK